MRCLSLIADDLDEASLPAVVPVLFPALLSVVQDATAGPSILRRALQVLHACLLAIAYMPAAVAGRMRPLVLPHVPTWLTICAALLERPLAPADAQQCGVQMEALKVAQRVRLPSRVPCPRVHFAHSHAYSFSIAVAGQLPGVRQGRAAEWGDTALACRRVGSLDTGT